MNKQEIKMKVKLLCSHNKFEGYLCPDLYAIEYAFTLKLCLPLVTSNGNLLVYARIEMVMNFGTHIHHVIC